MLRKKQSEENMIDSFSLVTSLDQLRPDGDRPRKSEVYSCRTAFVIWLLSFLNEGQIRDRTLFVSFLSFIFICSHLSTIDLTSL